MPRIIIVTGASQPTPSPSDRAYLDALQSRGAAVSIGSWHDGIAPFRGADLVVLRSTWDYHRHLAAYRGWLDAMVEVGVPLANAPLLVRWNLDKRYLQDLAAAGIPVPEQRVVPREPLAIRHVLAEMGWTRAVAKPSAGASGHGVTLVTPATLDRLWPEIAAAAHPHDVVVQEFVPAIADAGQVSCVFYAGDFSHAVRFVPTAGEFRINSRFAPEVLPHVAAADEMAAARRVLAVLPSAPLYARIDMVRRGEGMLLLEAEVHEPGLMHQYVPAGARRFADATLDWIGERRAA
ncbi:MAG: RimK family alpha-L-glutamate ligase [Alphaproteobacteria bacterium]